MIKKLLNIFLVFFKIGTLTVGSGYAMLPIMQTEFCDKRKWISDEEMTDVLGLAQSLPGIVAGNTASMIGYKLAGTLGSIVGLIGTILPSFIIILIIAILFPTIAHNTYIQRALLGAQAGITALIISYAFRIGRKVLKDIFSVCIMILALILGLFLNVNLFILVICGAVAGWIYYTVRRAKTIDL